jgi:hypothetical protein
MDFDDKRGLGIEEQRKQVEIDLASLGRQIDEMDSKIRAYLADKKNRPHPRHLDLIDKIQGFRIPNSVVSKHLAVLLDNLQWKLHYNKRAWNQLWEHAETQSKKHAGIQGPAVAGGPASDDGDARIQTKAQYSLDTLWEIQQEKLKLYGYTDIQETKAEFKKRMIREYKALNQDKKQRQEIIMTFDKESRQCRLDVK